MQITNYEEYKKVRSDYSSGDSHLVYNEILGFKPDWFVKLFIDCGAIIKKDGAWYVHADQPVGVIFSYYRGERRDKRRVCGTIDEIRKELAGDRNSKIEYFPTTYVNLSEWEKFFRYGADKIEQLDRDAIDSLAESKEFDG